MEAILQEHLFNTGVQVTGNIYQDGFRKISPNGIIQIAFYTEKVPSNYSFEFAQDALIEKENFLIKPIIKGGLLSKYAYFKKTN